ncbi:MAG: sugar phosphate isomerase/epimerase [Armatimonadaceae bacterium]
MTEPQSGQKGISGKNAELSGQESKEKIAMRHPNFRPVYLSPSSVTVAEPISPLLEEPVGLEGELLPMPDILDKDESEPFRYCLNTSTLRGHKLPLNELVDIAAAAGYESIEPWVDEIEKFAAEGGDLRDLSARIQDLGLTVEGGIGFFEWMVDDDELRREGFERARHAMGLLARLGAKRVAAPPFGAQKPEAATVDLFAAADRYRELCIVAEEYRVVPLVEVWGFSKNLSRLGAAALIAMESGHPDAGILADSYHLYKGGSPLSALRALSGDILPLFHINDYPNIPAETITDADRVYPGDGVAPLESLFHSLRQIGFNGVLSLELFNQEYYQQDPLHVARTGLEKLRSVVRKSVE